MRTAEADLYDWHSTGDVAHKAGPGCDPQDELVCVTVYERGAVKMVRRLAA